MSADIHIADHVLAALSQSADVSRFLEGAMMDNDGRRWTAMDNDKTDA